MYAFQACGHWFSAVGLDRYKAVALRAGTPASSPFRDPTVFEQGHVGGRLAIWHLAAACSWKQPRFIYAQTTLGILPRVLASSREKRYDPTFPIVAPSPAGVPTDCWCVPVYIVLMYAAIGSMNVCTLLSFSDQQHARHPREEGRFRVLKSVCIFLNASTQTRLKTFSSTWRRAWTKAAQRARATGSSRCGIQTLLQRKF